MDVTKQQYNQPIGRSTQALWQAPLSQEAQSVYTMCLRIYIPVFVNNLYGRQRIAPVLAMLSFAYLDNCTREPHQ